MIFKEWLLNLNIWTLWLVDDSIKKKERSYFPPWTQLGNFGYPLWHIWCFKWNFMNCWIYYHEIWLRHSQNFRISISSNAYWHNITEQLECWIYHPPFVFFLYPEQNLDVEFQMQKVSTFLFDSSHWYWIHKSCQPTQIFHGHFKLCKREISPPPP